MSPCTFWRHFGDIFFVFKVYFSAVLLGRNNEVQKRVDAVVKYSVNHTKNLEKMQKTGGVENRDMDRGSE